MIKLKTENPKSQQASKQLWFSYIAGRTFSSFIHKDKNQKQT
jgi:hypothetical protein